MLTNNQVSACARTSVGERHRAEAARAAEAEARARRAAAEAAEAAQHVCRELRRRRQRRWSAGVEVRREGAAASAAEEAAWLTMECCATATSSLEVATAAHQLHVRQEESFRLNLN